MTLELYTKKFSYLKDFEKKMPGIHDGLEILKIIKEEKNDLVFSKNSKSSLGEVIYYDFVENKLTSYCIESLNMKLQSIYTDHIINNKVILYNKLYWIFYSVLEKNINKNSYEFVSNFSIQDILTKFIHGLRQNLTADPSKFFVHKIIKSYRQNYLNITGEHFYLLMFNFIMDLWGELILSYEKSDDSIAFNPIYQTDLDNLIYFSFDLMLLGNTKLFETFNFKNHDLKKHLDQIYLVYNASNDRYKLAINDLLRCLVISCSVEVICAEKDLNNIFIENLKNGLHKSSEQ